MKKERKARKYVKENKVFKLRKTKSAEYYGCDANTGIYEVRHDLKKNTWSCNCKNIRLTECAHIIAVKIYLLIKGDRIGKEI